MSDRRANEAAMRPCLPRWALACTLALIGLQTGCGTISTFAGSPSERSTLIYGGSRTDLASLGDCFNKCSGGPFFAPFILLDLSLSFVADTLMLPFILARPSDPDPLPDPEKGEDR